MGREKSLKFYQSLRIAPKILHERHHFNHLEEESKGLELRQIGILDLPRVTQLDSTIISIQMIGIKIISLRKKASFILAFSTTVYCNSDDYKLIMLFLHVVVYKYDCTHFRVKLAKGAQPF